ncbi:helix-turn-helix domain-containing protein [Ramlibacter albus]|uniref:Winged helix-turn-helix domain-containing protein n=1 Tax=Ramlibacter albus TaxID=2079448 RepID=A0A923S409_9BURK|nr:helix-turn-helix domain-containing protein [Ramlibacter albus]MBC5766986.1 winged helix-turn-helix domain-containing protein [Ramlibacter albus]
MPLGADDEAALHANRLLDLLDAKTLAVVAKDLTRVPLEIRAQLMVEGKPIRYAWFPTGGVMSMLASVQGTQATIEVGTIGNEGVVGLPLFLGAPRAPGDCFAQMLGERRPTVSRAASLLQQRHAIAYSRGRITVVDRAKLEDISCPCYGLVRAEYDSMLRSRG